MSRILILDFGGQTTQLIARRVREARVYCEIQPFSWSWEEIQAFSPDGVILSGGPASVTDPDAPMPDPRLLEGQLGVPMLGICYGFQAMTVAHGGTVESGREREYGRARVHAVAPCPLTAGWTEETVWMSHGDRLTVPPRGFHIAAMTENGVAAVMAHTTEPWFGVQFHPEVIHTPRGAELLERFVLSVCRCRPDWTMHAFVTQATAAIQARVGEEKVLCGLSGGVDSAVTALLLHHAIGAQLECVFVDTGLLRHGEADDVVRTFRDELGLSLHAVDASEAFFSALDGVSDPELKRKRIGKTFIDVFEREARRLQGDAPIRFLAQGTLYPDVVESVSVRGGPSATIKSHHNVGGLPERLGFQLVEPLRELFKDEVRELGREVGLPERLIRRQPFPGPGLAVRIPGEVTRPAADLLRRADHILREELEKEPFHGEIWQSFAVLLPVKTVGVMGDQRTYENVCALRAVSSTDGMTADWYPIPHAVLGRISNRIINEVRGFNRVVYDISSKPPATIEWE